MKSRDCDGHGHDCDGLDHGHIFLHHYRQHDQMYPRVHVKRWRRPMVESEVFSVSMDDGDGDKRRW